MSEDSFSDENYQLEVSLCNIRKELITMLEGYDKSLCTVCLEHKCSCSKDANKIDETTVYVDSSDENDIANGWIIKEAKDTKIDTKIEKELEEDDDEPEEVDDEPEEDDDEPEEDDDEPEEDDDEPEEDDDEPEEDDDEPEEDDDESEEDDDEPEVHAVGLGCIAPPASSLPRPMWESPKKEENSTSTQEKEPVHPDIEAWMESSRPELRFVKEPIILQNLLYMDRQKRFQNLPTNNNNNAVEAFFQYFKMTNDTAVTCMSSRLASACSTPATKDYTYF